ncbi:glycosyltransferase family 4 protein, partial [Angustibacter aerolatus]
VRAELSRLRHCPPGDVARAAAVLRAADAVTVSHATDLAIARRLGVRPHHLTLVPDVALPVHALADPHPLPSRSRRAAAPPWVVGLSGAPDQVVATGLLCALRHDPDAHLLLAGCSASGRARLRVLAEQAGVAARVHLAGRLRPERVVRLVDDAAVVVATSREGGNGLTALLAMCRARAVVAVDSAPARDVVDDGTTGCLTPAREPADLARTVLELVHDPWRRLALGEAVAARAAARFGGSTVREQLLRAFEGDAPVAVPLSRRVGA